MAPIGHADETVQVCGSYANHVFARTAPVSGMRVSGTCPNPPYTANGFGLSSSGTSTRGEAVHWQADTPAGLAIVGAGTNSMVSAGLNSAGGDFGGGFYWAGGGAQTHDSETSFGVGPFLSSYFGFQLVCGVSKCTQPAQLDIGAISLYVRETSGPSFAAPTGLWQASGWVRGSWPFFAWGNLPSGLCSLSATLNGQLINTTTSGQDVSSWHQCAAPPINQAVDTSRYGQGAVPLTLGAGDAAGVPASLSKTVYIDNHSLLSPRQVRRMLPRRPGRSTSGWWAWPAPRGLLGCRARSMVRPPTGTRAAPRRSRWPGLASIRSPARRP